MQGLSNVTARVLLALAIVACAAPARAQGTAPDALVAPQLVEDVRPEAPAGATAPVDVKLEIVVDKDGSVVEAKVLASAGVEYDAAAVSAARRLRFAPARKGDTPIKAKIPFTVHFEPKPAGKAPEAKPSESAPQKRASVRIRVRVDDVPLPGATVTVAATCAGCVDRKSATTDDKGIASFEALGPGAHDVKVELDGFLPFTSREVLVEGARAEVSVQLSPKPVEGEIVVVGEKPPREATKYTFEAETIRKVPGTGGDTLKVLEVTPGVGRAPNQTGGLLVRGSGPDDTIVFVDGTAIPLIFHFGSLNSVIPTEALEKLEFVPGNYGPEYGRALGGVVSLGLKSPRKDKVGGVAQVDVIDGRVFAEGPIHPRLRFMVGARRSWIDAWFGKILEATGNGVTTAPVYYDAQAVLEADLTRSTTGRLAFFGASDALRIVVDSPSATDPTPGAFNLLSSFWRVQARFRTQLDGGKTRLEHTVSYGREVRDLRFGTIRIGIDALPLVYRGELRSKLGKGIYAAAGIDLDYQTARVDITAPSPDGVTDPPTPNFGKPPIVFATDSSVYRPAAYALLELEPRKGVRIVPSTRVDYTREGKTWNVSPRITGRLAVAEGTTLKGGAGLFYQPGLPQETIPPYGSATLRNNRALHQSLGLEQVLAKGLEVSIEGFHKVLDDIIVQSPAAGRTLSGVVYSNAGSGRVFGAELLIKARRGAFTGWLAYTLSRSTRIDGAGRKERLFEFDQTHNLAAVASYAWGRGWEAGARFRLVSGNPYTPYVGGIADLDAGAYAAVSGALYSARIAPYHALDLRLEKTWKVGWGVLTGYAELRNAYNRANPEALMYNYNYTQTGITAGLPLTPNLGVRGTL